MLSYHTLTAYPLVLSGLRSSMRKRPRASLRTESTGPVLSRAKRWRSTQAFASGTLSRPPRSTRPLTLTAWEKSAVGMPTSSNRLRRKLAEIFRIEVLEVRLQRVGVEGTAPGTGLDGAFTGVDGRELEQRLACQDWGLESQCQRDRIGRARVDLNDRIAPIDVQLGEVGVVLHLRDDHLAQLGAQPNDHLLE